MKILDIQEHIENIAYKTTIWMNIHWSLTEGGREVAIVKRKEQR